MSHSKTPHMASEEFRRWGYRTIDWVAEYMDRVEELPVLAQTQPGEIREALPDVPPSEGEPFEQLLADLDRVLMRGITHWQSPNFFAFFPANHSGPSILGELLSAGMGVQGMLWATSPACTELETHVLDWLVGMLDLPSRFLSTGKGGGVIQDTASSASLCALLAARERTTDFLTNVRGLDQNLSAYASPEAHSCIEKAVKIAGIGSENLCPIEVDSSFALRPAALQAAISRDRAEGRTPFFVSATIGTTSSNAIDPVRAIGEICRREGVWLHVDAAMSGTAALCPEFRWIQDGLELADSYCFNPHKWMFTNFDCDCFYVADRSSLIWTLSVLPEYLRNEATESGEVIDYRDWHIPLGRRFRALKLWFVIRYYGVAGLRAHVREQVELTQELASWIEQDPDFEIVAPTPLNLVCFRLKGSNRANEELVEQLNSSGRLYLNQTKLGDRVTLRMSVGGTYTERHHVENAWQFIKATASALRR